MTIKDIEVSSFHDLKNINSINGIYELVVDEISMVIQEKLTGNQHVRISLYVEVNILNQLLAPFNFPRIILIQKDKKDIEIERLNILLDEKDKVIKRQKKYINELEQKVHDTIIESITANKELIISRRY